MVPKTGPDRYRPPIPMPIPASIGNWQLALPALAAGFFIGMAAHRCHARAASKPNLTALAL